MNFEYTMIEYDVASTVARIFVPGDHTDKAREIVNGYLKRRFATISKFLSDNGIHIDASPLLTPEIGDINAECMLDTTYAAWIRGCLRTDVYDDWDFEEMQNTLVVKDISELTVETGPFENVDVGVYATCRGFEIGFEFTDRKSWLEPWMVR